MRRVISWVLLGAVLVLLLEVGYQNMVIERQRATLQDLVGNCMGEQ